MNALEEFNDAQQKEIIREVGDSSMVSAEGLAYGIRNYLKSLRRQAEVAKAFYFGRLDEAFGALLDLPEDIRQGIDQLIWEAAGEEPIDPSLPESQSLIASAVICSLEQRMGLIS